VVLSISFCRPVTIIRCTFFFYRLVWSVGIGIACVAGHRRGKKESKGARESPSFFLFPPPRRLPRRLASVRQYWTWMKKKITHQTGFRVNIEIHLCYNLEHDNQLVESSDEAWVLPCLTPLSLNQWSVNWCRGWSNSWHQWYQPLNDNNNTES